VTRRLCKTWDDNQLRPGRSSGKRKKGEVDNHACSTQKRTTRRTAAHLEYRRDDGKGQERGTRRVRGDRSVRSSTSEAVRFRAPSLGVEKKFEGEKTQTKHPLRPTRRAGDRDKWIHKTDSWANRQKEQGGVTGIEGTCGGERQILRGAAAPHQSVCPFLITYGT